MNRSIPDPTGGISPDLPGAVRRARTEQAERSDAIGQIRSAEIARLELLHDAVRPLFAQVPQHIDLFDTGVTRGDHPRLFIDMIGFVELDRDGRTYRLVQDSRHGRVVIAEAEGMEATVEHVAAYVAHRLVERERALAGDTTVEAAALRLLAASPPGHGSAAARTSMRTDRLIEVPVPPRRRQPRKRLSDAVRFVVQFVVQFLGTIALLLVLMGLGYLLYHLVRGWLVARHGFPPE